MDRSHNTPRGHRHWVRVVRGPNHRRVLPEVVADVLPHANASKWQHSTVHSLGKSNDIWNNLKRPEEERARVSTGQHANQRRCVHS